MEQLEDKDLKLRVLSDEQSKVYKMKEMSREKTRQQVATVKRQLQRERVLKMDAYQRVDELQTQVNISVVLSRLLQWVKCKQDVNMHRYRCNHV